MDAFITRRGGTGGGLNFSVVGGTTQPENPKENTIWVNTDAEITGWSFSANKPTEPQEGMVWFITGIQSPAGFNTLKDNVLMVYPQKAMQYTEGAWNAVDATIWIEETWENLYVYLLSGPDKCVDVTGGWVEQAMGLSSDNSYAGDMTITDYDDYTRIYGVQFGNRVYRTQNKIDMSQYKTIVIDMDVKASAGLFQFRLLTALGSHINSNAAYSKNFGSATGRRIERIDVTNINSTCYVVFSMYTYNSGDTVANIYSMHME